MGPELYTREKGGIAVQFHESPTPLQNDAALHRLHLPFRCSQEPRHVPVGSRSLADVILKSSDVKVCNEALKVPSLGGRKNLHNLHIGCKAVAPKAQQKPRLQSKSRTEDGLTRHLQSWKRSMFQSQVSWEVLEILPRSFTSNLFSKSSEFGSNKCKNAKQDKTRHCPSSALRRTSCEGNE